MSLDITLSVPGMVEVYDSNITHNLTAMADAACIYEVLWRPEEAGIITAGQLIEPLHAGLMRLRSNPELFKRMNPPNGWGNYDDFVRFIEELLAKCEEHPTAKVSADR